MITLPLGRGYGENNPEIQKAIIDYYTKIDQKLGKNAVQDCTQCKSAIGDVDCTYTYCYLCAARIPVRIGEYCVDCSYDESFTTGNGSYPECEHIIPCETKEVEMNPYLRMIMITDVTQILIRKIITLNQF